VLVRFLLPASLVFSTTLLAKQKDTCYSVGLVTVKKENAKYLKKRYHYSDSECILFESRNFMTLRCGCFEKKIDAKNALVTTYAQYNGAYVVSTKKERFANKVTLDSLTTQKPKQTKQITPTSSVKLKKKQLEVTSIQKKEPVVTMEPQPVYVELNTTSKVDHLEHLGLEDLNGFIYEDAQNKYDNVSLINFNQYNLDSFFDLEYHVGDGNNSYDGNSIAVLKELYQKNYTQNSLDLQKQNYLEGLTFGMSVYENVGESHDKYKRGSNWQYTMNLKLNLLKNGYFYMQKKKKQKKIFQKVNYLKHLSALLQKNYEEKLYGVEFMESEINYRYTLVAQKLYNKLLQHSDIYLQDAHTTVWDVEHLQEQLENVKVLKDIYKIQTRSKIDRVLYNFLNNIQAVSLIPKDQFNALVVKNNPSLQLIHKKIELTTIDTNYLDAIDLKVVSEFTKEDSIGWYDKVGFELSIPFGKETKNNFNVIRRNGYFIEKASIKENLEQKVDYLYNLFIYNQKYISILQNELNYVYEKYAQLNDTHKNDIDRLTLLMKIDVEKKKRDIMVQRLKTYKVLLELYRVANTTNINEFVQK